jgi:hypothetical protein
MSKKILLTSVCRPLGSKYGGAPSVGYELLYRKSTVKKMGTGAKPVLLWLALFFGLSTLNSQLSPAFAQSYSIDWSTIDGGGSTSTGGVYSVSGTIGQHDAGDPMTGGDFSLTGGFWALPTMVQTPDAPTLHITNAAPGFATIWWTPPTPGFTLQTTDSLSPTNWVNAPNGTNNPAAVPATLPARFYRLFKP